MIAPLIARSTPQLAVLALLAGTGTATAATTPADPSRQNKTVTQASESPSGRTTVIETGSGHHRTVIQQGHDEDLLIEQHGRDHHTVSIQRGHGQKLVVKQDGIGAAASVIQDGSANTTAVSQSGRSGEVTIRQSGSGNQVYVNQGKPAPVSTVARPDTRSDR